MLDLESLDNIRELITLLAAHVDLAFDWLFPLPAILKVIPVEFFAPFFVGAFICNAAPHLAAGLRGEPFPTPFAKPRGIGHSSPVTNTLWGFFNLAVGIALLILRPMTLGLNAITLALAAGALLMGLYLARHFGKVRAGEMPRKN